jgi:E3 ubiquitin-protein ligase RAD18
MMYNANLDRSLANRKTKAELRRDIKKWEEGMSKKKKPVVEDLVKYQVRLAQVLSDVTCKITN